MTDNNIATPKKDALRVENNDRIEIEYLHLQCPGKTHQEIRQAIRTVGPVRADIIDYLER